MEALGLAGAGLSIATICRRLGRAYGPVRPPARLPVLDELIATILSQNTSDANSSAAFRELCARFPAARGQSAPDGRKRAAADSADRRLRRRSPDWHAVMRARPSAIARAIKRGGLARQKAPRIKAILREIHQRHGRLSLNFLRTMPVGQAMDYLRQLPGVGPKTAACVLLFACGKPVLPVDTHVHRVSQRLGLIGLRTSAEKAHQELARLVPEGKVLEFHIQLIRHGRTICSAGTPHCAACPLLPGCPRSRQPTPAPHMPKGGRHRQQ